MEYTKDMILSVNYGQDGKTEKGIWKVLNKISEKISRHKIMTMVISLTVVLSILDFVLISSFINVLGSI